MTQAARSDGRGAYHEDFRLSITKVLGDQLAQALTHLGRAPLAEQYLASLDERPGVSVLPVWQSGRGRARGVARGDHPG